MQILLASDLCLSKCHAIAYVLELYEQELHYYVLVIYWPFNYTCHAPTMGTTATKTATEWSNDIHDDDATQRTIADVDVLILSINFLKKFHRNV